MAIFASKIIDTTTDTELHEMKTFDHWLSIESEAMPYIKSFEEARYDPVLVLHSSGSTGLQSRLRLKHRSYSLLHRSTQGNYSDKPVVNKQAERVRRPAGRWHDTV